LLPGRERIRKGSIIKKTLSIKQFHYSSPLLYFAAMENGEANSKVAVSCSKKLGKANIRNTTKRQIMGGYANIRHKIAINIDMVIIPRAAKAGARAYQNVLERGIKGVGLCAT
jgi:ribonuclease P protein component